MFGCCCANKKALKNKEQQQKNAASVEAQKTQIEQVVMGDNDSNVNTSKSPINTPMSPISDSSAGVALKSNDKSNSSEEGNNLSGLIMSDGLVGEMLLLLFYFHVKMYILSHTCLQLFMDFRNY